MKSKFKERKGITLIALVITIIVLLILAGVSIATLVGENGILTRANNASKAQIEGQVKEEVRLAVQAVKIYAEEMSTKTAEGWLASENIGDTSTETEYDDLTIAQRATIIGQLRYDLTVEKGYKIISNEGTGVKVTYQTDAYKKATNNADAKIEIEVTITDNIFAIGEGTASVDPETPVDPEDPTDPSDPTLPSTGVTATDIANDPTLLGEEVSNYTVDSSVADSNIKWKIFYADGETDEDGNAIAEEDRHIYLIASDYIQIAKAPSKTVKVNDVETTYSLNTGDTAYKGYFTNMLNAYNGSADITDSKIKALNNHYFNLANNGAGYSSISNNMKSVAYMLDTSIWSKYAMTDKAEYAIGGPTVELLFKSYNKKYDTQYKARAKSSTGYEISKDNGENWANYYSGMLSTTDDIYVIRSTGKTAGMWLASPSASNANYVMYAYCNGLVKYYYYNEINYGFRPLVCLKSGIQLEEQEDGTYHVK